MNVRIDNVYISNHDDVKPNRIQELRIEKLFLGPGGFSMHLRAERIDIPDQEVKALRSAGASAAAALEALRWNSDYSTAFEALRTCRVT